jgi:thiol-disulfide isomerase/thioredoxin
MMVAAQDGVITRELFEGAQTYAEYIASIAQNRAKFDASYAGTAVPESLAQRLRTLVARPDGPAKLLVIGEDWCPDVYRGMPVAQRIAEAAGIEMRVLPRDQHLDIAEHFKKDGEFLSIPVLIFLTRDFKHIAHFIERPARANAEMHDALSPVFGPSGTRQLTEKLGRALTDEEKESARIDAARRYDEFQNGPTWANWRDYTVQEVVELLEAAR